MGEQGASGNLERGAARKSTRVPCGHARCHHGCREAVLDGGTGATCPNSARLLTNWSHLAEASWFGKSTSAKRLP